MLLISLLTFVYSGDKFRPQSPVFGQQPAGIRNALVSLHTNTSVFNVPQQVATKFVTAMKILAHEHTEGMRTGTAPNH